MSTESGAASTPELEAELIQAAAVAVSIVEDLKYGSANIQLNPNTPMFEVYNERIRQDDKWGPQHHSPALWLLILMEEVGEAAAEVALPFSMEAELATFVEEIEELGMRVRAFLDKEVFPK